MKKMLLLVTLILFSWSGVAMADTTAVGWDTVKDTSDFLGTGYEPGEGQPGQAATGIVWSRHNLSSFGEHFQAIRSGYAMTDDGTIMGASAQAGFATTQICVFCHTPHHSSKISGVGPLWNRNSAGNFTPYSKGGDGMTLAGTSTGPSGTINTGATGSSLTCLSCHDGVTQIDALLNRPGKGSTTGGTGSGENLNWIFRENPVSDADVLKGGEASRLRIGEDLTDDHPINIYYRGEGGTDDVPRASLRPSGTTIADIAMVQAQSFAGVGASAFVLGRSDNNWAVYGYINTAATIEDLLKGSPGNGKVECTSCHDPHYRNQTNNDPPVVCNYSSGTDRDNCFTVVASDPDSPEAIAYIEGDDVDGLFLRRVGGNSNSGVCRTCHNK